MPVSGGGGGDVSTSKVATSGDSSHGGGSESPADAGTSVNGGEGGRAGAGGDTSGKPAKLTPSCARCRAKKLKCDQ